MSDAPNEENQSSNMDPLNYQENQVHDKFYIYIRSLPNYLKRGVVEG